MQTDKVADDRDALVNEIGRLILQDSRYADGNWRGIALVYTREPGVETTDGYIYYDDDSYHGDDYKPELPDSNSGAISDAIDKLLDAMAEDNGKRWQQMLYQIWKPGPDFRVTFEYDRPDRWSITSFNEAGATSFARQIDPAVR